MDRPVEFERRENGPLKQNEKFKILQTHSFHENIALRKKNVWVECPSKTYIFAFQPPWP